MRAKVYSSLWLNLSYLFIPALMSIFQKSDFLSSTRLHFVSFWFWNSGAQCKVVKAIFKSPLWKMRSLVGRGKNEGTDGIFNNSYMVRLTCAVKHMLILKNHERLSREWQPDHHHWRLTDIYISVSNQLVEGYFGQNTRRHETTTLPNHSAHLLIPRCQVIYHFVRRQSGVR